MPVFASSYSLFLIALLGFDLSYLHLSSNLDPSPSSLLLCSPLNKNSLLSVFGEIIFETVYIGSVEFCVIFFFFFYKAIKFTFKNQAFKVAF